jgi:hypothetical protein
VVGHAGLIQIVKTCRPLHPKSKRPLPSLSRKGHAGLAPTVNLDSSRFTPSPSRHVQANNFKMPLQGAP